MIKNYLLIGLRNIRRNKSFSLITISGLVLGMAAFAMIMEYVVFEMSYDKFQSTSKNIYRVAFTIKAEDKEAASYATTFLPIAPTMKDEFPEIVDYNRILYLDRHAVVSYEDKIFQQENVIYADPTFFTFFDYPLLQGDAKTVLTETNTVVLSESLSKKYFGDINPVGKFIKLNEEFNELNLLVTGIHKDIPENTHIKPKMVVSLRSVETLPETVANNWSWPIYLNYIRLQPGSEASLVESKLPKFAKQHIQRNSQKGGEYSFFLQPLSSIHLDSHLQYEIEENGSATMIYLLMIAAILILVIAYVNYINLSTARSLSRAKEVGMRKVLGSRTGQLISQFLMEAGTLNFIALCSAAALVLSIQNSFQQFTGSNFNFSVVNTGWFWFLVIGCLVVGTFLSALYPSIVLAGFKPISALKGQAKSQGGSFTRQTLVIFQFAATIGLMINAYAIYFQVDLMRSESLGININPILVVNAPRIVEKSNVMEIQNNNDPFKTSTLNTSGVRSVSVSASIPGVWISKSRGIYRRGHEQEKDLTFYTLGADYDFLNTYSLQLLAGRNFSEDYAADANAIVLTEKAMKQLGFSNPEEALNERVMVAQNEKEVIGVVRDYHHMGLRENYQAIIFYPDWEHREFYSIRLEEGSNQNVAGILSSLEEKWKTIYPSNPFEHTFLNDSFQQQYSADVKFGKIFNLFTLLAIILACLGLFGLASFITRKRTKEIGVRKVLGSTTTQITLLLLKDVGVLLLSAGLIAVPVAYFSLASWLDQFAFRIDLTWWIFVIPLLCVSLIATVSISFQIIKAALRNPVKSLRYE